MSKRTPINISKPIVIFKRNGKHFTNATKQDFDNDVSYLQGTKPEDLKFLFKGKRLQIKDDPIVLHSIELLLKSGVTKIPNEFFEMDE